MQVVSLKELPTCPNGHGVEMKRLLDNDDAQVTQIRLLPGEALKKHITPVDVIFYVLQGEGEIEIADEIRHVRTDELIYSPAKIPHRLMNQGGSDLRFLVIKLMRSTEKS
jgi:mannose-6-phosphate isomerase-like protein (cupin superfamily)